MKEHNPNLDYYTYPLQKDQKLDVPTTEPSDPTSENLSNETPSPATASVQEMTPHEREAKRTFSNIAFSVVGMLAIWLAALYGISKAAIYLLPESWYTPTFSVFSSTFSLILIAIPSLYLMVRKMPAVKPTLQPTKLGGARFTILIFISLGVMIVGSLVSNIAMAFFTAYTGLELFNSLEVITSCPAWVILLCTVILSPIFEEILCRKILLTRLLPYGEVTAIVLSSLLFAVIHGNLFQIVYAFGVGTILAFLYLRTGRLRYCCLLHIILNALGSLVSVLLMSKVDAALLTAMEEFLQGSRLVEETLPILFANSTPLILISLYNGTLYAAALAGLILLFIWRKHFRAQRNPGDLCVNRTLSLTFTSVGGIVLLVFSVFFTMLNMGLFANF